MSKIRILPDSVSNKIAAGEVVERPASVVKELVENSLDAGASRISVSVERAGERLISVLDDGEGMDPDDAMLCLEPHATSKIASAEDISSIRSFGFRGEAMPSIASVSRMTVRSRRRESREGVEVSVHGGKFISSAPAGCAPGSEMLVRELFFNTPARRKFLRSAATEERHIVETVSILSLSNPHVSFELSLDGRKSFSSPAGDDLIPRIRELFGRELAEALVPVSWTEYGVSVSGYIARRGFTRPSRHEQRIFINGRPVEALPVYRGIREGCGPTLDKGRHQPAFLFLSLDPSLVDVNVHPAKREVRFRKEFEIVAAVRAAVASAIRLSEATLMNFETSFEEPSGEGHAVTPVRESPPPSSSPPVEDALDRIMCASHVDYTPSGVATVNAMKSAALHSMPGRPSPQSLLPDEPQGEAPFRLETHSASSREPQSFPGSPGLRILGVLEDSYIVASIPGGLVLIDQHAAHERVLYERILKGVDGSLSQKLLIPISIELSRSDSAFVARNTELFERLGFEIEPFGENAVKLNAIPAALSQDNAGGMLKDILSELASEGSLQGRIESDSIARAACAAAIKSHDRLSVQEAESLIRQMAKCELPFSCPHGRPTVINISVRELERRFGRK